MSWNLQSILVKYHCSFLQLLLRLRLKSWQWNHKQLASWNVKDEIEINSASSSDHSFCFVSKYSRRKALVCSNVPNLSLMLTVNSQFFLSCFKESLSTSFVTQIAIIYTSLHANSACSHQRTMLKGYDINYSLFSISLKRVLFPLSHLCIFLPFKIKTIYICIYV